MAKKAVKRKKVAKKKKKVVKKKATKKKKKVVRKKVPVTKKATKKKIVRVPKLSGQLASKYNSRLALRDLILFALLSLVSFILFLATGNGIYKDTFYLLAMLFGFIAVAFLIVFLAFTFSRDKLRRR